MRSLQPPLARAAAASCWWAASTDTARESCRPPSQILGRGVPALVVWVTGAEIWFDQRACDVGETKPPARTSGRVSRCRGTAPSYPAHAPTAARQVAQHGKLPTDRASRMEF